VLDKNSGRPSNAVGCMIGLALLWLVLLPIFAVEHAARNDARLVRKGGKASLLSTVDTPLDVAIETKDGSTSDQCRWIGATTSYVFARCSGPIRVLRRDDIKALNFSTPR